MSERWLQRLALLDRLDTSACSTSPARQPPAQTGSSAALSSTTMPRGAGSTTRYQVPSIGCQCPATAVLALGIRRLSATVILSACGNTTATKSPCSRTRLPPLPAKPRNQAGVKGGSDGTRTRDLRRDRPAF